MYGRQVKAWGISATPLRLLFWLTMQYIWPLLYATVALSLCACTYGGVRMLFHALHILLTDVRTVHCWASGARSLWSGVQNFRWGACRLPLSRWLGFVHVPRDSLVNLCWLFGCHGWWCFGLVVVPRPPGWVLVVDVSSCWRFGKHTRRFWCACTFG